VYVGFPQSHDVVGAGSVYPDWRKGTSAVLNSSDSWLWNKNATPPITPRGRQEFARFFNGLTLLDPGIVSPSLWRPEPNDLGVTPTDVFQFCGVGRKP
jgi:hypothetical protein